MEDTRTVAVAEPTQPNAISRIRLASEWWSGKAPLRVEVDAPGEADAIRWYDLASGAEASSQLLAQLQPACPGLTQEMLADLLTPDEEPAGGAYDRGRIRLASTFSVRARRLEQKVKRGTAQRAGVLIFQPVELLAGDDWLLTCWHGTRTFAGAEPLADGEAGRVDEIYASVAARWERSGCLKAGDLGVLIMDELATGYRAAGWALAAWHEDWELSLYVDDELSNPDELPHLWGSMAVLRDWLNPLNKPGLRKDPERAWLPISDHEQVIALDDRIDDTLDQLRSLSNVMRSSFSVLHVQMAELERKRKERSQHLIELGAALFLVPTLVVGLYGANTWVPGQGRHWGFWVMVAVLLAASGAALYLVLKMRRDEESEVQQLNSERVQIRDELLRGLQ